MTGTPGNSGVLFISSQISINPVQNVQEKTSKEGTALCRSEFSELPGFDCRLEADVLADHDREASRAQRGKDLGVALALSS
jgi:hypothetical protein